VGDVFLANQAPGVAVQGSIRCQLVELIELQPDDVSLCIRPDKDQIDDAHSPVIDEPAQGGDDLTSELVASELDQKVLNRPDVHLDTPHGVVVAHRIAISKLLSFPPQHREWRRRSGRTG
jgi:hypothetical protein